MPRMVLALAAGALVVCALVQSGVAASHVIPPAPRSQPDALGTAAEPDGTLASGCQRVPATGYLNTGQAASTTAEYANYWSWSSGSAGGSFDWSIRKNDGTVVASASSVTTGDSRSVPANVYTWRVVNRSASPQAWNVCYDVF